ncbi:response regulator, partial [uncultured Oscillibacter sp.]
IHEDILCDRLRLNQILLNLLGNSIKYTPAGGIVSIRVTEKPCAPAGHAAYEFYVRDTGIGMSEEFVAHIFEPFERERNSTTSGIQGTGLGMAITRNIVEMMNGTIHVKSRQGVGTEFSVDLTFRLCSDEKQPITIPELTGCRALVVDDDFNTCDSVSCMLQQIGMRAEWTLSGKEAVLRTRQAVMRRDHYSAYIIDWLLPDMNGIEVTRRIRKECGDEVPIIVLTAYDWADIEDEAKEAGVTAFCGKPLFLSELRDCLLSVVSTEEPPEESTTEPIQSLDLGRILLAEDNELNQEIAQAILEEAGFTVEIAENGQIALDMLTRAEPDYYQLILMDVQMPVMNGYEATRAIRALENPALSSIPILAMTANAFEEDKQAALQCGMNSHISKPIDIAKLLETLGNVLRNR